MARNEVRREREMTKDPSLCLTHTTKYVQISNLCFTTNVVQFSKITGGSVDKISKKQQLPEVFCGTCHLTKLIK